MSQILTILESILQLIIAINLISFHAYSFDIFVPRALPILSMQVASNWLSNFISHYFLMEIC